MPVQLTLRNPKGGAVLSERTYDDGYRIDAVSGWLVVVDRNGSVVAAHAACPGLEGRTVQHSSAAATGEPELPYPAGETATYPIRSGDTVDDGFPQQLANEARDDDDRFAAELLTDLRILGDTYGPLGVAVAAASLTDRRALIATLIDNRTRQPRPEPAVDVDGYEANLDALRAEVARLTGLLDDASREADRADRLVDEVRLHSEGARVAQNEAGRLREQLRDATDLAQQRLDEANRLREERDEYRSTVDLYRHRYGTTLRWNLDEEPQERTIPLTPAASGHPPVELSVSGSGIVTCDGLSLRVVYGEPVDGATMEGVVVDTPPRDEAEPHPITEDPRRPALDHWPSDAVLLTYRELRRLVSVHLEACDARQARAMLEGETPLRVSEVLDQ